MADTSPGKEDEPEPDAPTEAQEAKPEVPEAQEKPSDDPKPQHETNQEVNPSTAEAQEAKLASGGEADTTNKMEDANE